MSERLQNAEAVKLMKENKVVIFLIYCLYLCCNDKL